MQYFDIKVFVNSWSFVIYFLGLDTTQTQRNRNFTQDNSVFNLVVYL